MQAEEHPSEFSRRHVVGDIAHAVLEVPHNMHGRDFVVGDLHGAFDFLREALSRVRFDATRDRLFFVGDLVNRGQQSAEAGYWLEMPNVFSSRGNHDQSFIDLRALKRGELLNPPKEIQRKHSPNDREYGALRDMIERWAQGTPEHTLARIESAMRKLPLAIEIAGRHPDDPPCVIIHSDIPGGLLWADFKQELNQLTTFATYFALFDRGRQSSALSKMAEPLEPIAPDPVEDVDRVFCGHTTYIGYAEDARLENIINLDTGAVFAQAARNGLQFSLSKFPVCLPKAPEFHIGPILPALTLYNIWEDRCAVRLDENAFPATHSSL